MRAIVFAGAGGAEVMSYDERPDPEPGAGEVLVAATHAGLNPADLIQRAGHYPAPPGSPPDVPGLEVAGRVIACGPRTSVWREGDRVFGVVGGGGLADRVVVHERHLAAVPENLDEPGAAAVPEAFVTAHDAVFTRAGLAIGETLLVNGANGGVGTAAVQLGVAAGAHVLAAVRSEQSAARLRELGAEPVALGETAGADVVLELIGAPNLPGDLEALGPLGRVIVVGTGAGAETTVNLRALMGKRASLMGTVLRARPHEQKAAAVQAFARSVVPLLASGKVRPIVDRVFPAADAAAAFDHLAGRGKFGKVLLEF
ncbi:MAG TPA: zinc-binding dehydrogenase [Gaiellales bacterium]|jgi:NADPH:quinone reductase-like Zn-dependent oxidoreductase|nr:zinc-binding dehydrogenase [Gaiellales bacterium]